MLDTNIVSYLMKRHPLAQGYLPHLSESEPFISFITVGELYLWAEDGGWGERRRMELDRRLDTYTILPYDHNIARGYAMIASERKKSGKRMTVHDAWIAATCVWFGLPLVTHNRRDFDGIIGLEIISEA